VSEFVRVGSPSRVLELVAPFHAQAPEDVTPHAEAEAILFESLDRSLVVVVDVCEDLIGRESVPLRTAEGIARAQPVAEAKDRLKAPSPCTIGPGVDGVTSFRIYTLPAIDLNRKHSARRTNGWQT
jgi:hypothetical protein